MKDLRMQNAPSPNELCDLPPPSAELFMIGAVVEALMAEMPPEQRLKFADRIREAFLNHRELMAGVGARPSSQQVEAETQRKRAANWWSWIGPLVVTASARRAGKPLRTA